VGKDSVLMELKSRNLPFHYIVTATTRAPRSNEVHGVDYFFISHAEFAEMIENDELLEYALVYNDFKGIPKEQVRKAFASGKDVLLRIDVQGAETIRRLAPQALLIFLTVEHEQEMVDRLTARSTENPDSLKLRIAACRQELRRIDQFDYIVPNRANRLSETVDLILSILQAEHHRVKPRKVDL
jgi:guanylate kinase